MNTLITANESLPYTADNIPGAIVLLVFTLCLAWGTWKTYLKDKANSSGVSDYTKEQSVNHAVSHIEQQYTQACFHYEEAAREADELWEIINNTELNLALTARDGVDVFTQFNARRRENYEELRTTAEKYLIEKDIQEYRLNAAREKYSQRFDAEITNPNKRPIPFHYSQVNTPMLKQKLPYHMERNSSITRRR